MDPARPVPAGPPPRADWVREGRSAVRGGRDAWVSGAGVELRWSLADAPGGRAAFAAAADAALEPRRAALRAVEAMRRADAALSPQDRLYAAWARGAGRMVPAQGPVLVPPEPPPEDVPGTPCWWAVRLTRLVAVLRGRDWRRGLEAFRRAEPVACAAMVLRIPTLDEEALAVEAERLRALRRDGAAQGRDEARRAAGRRNLEIATWGSRGPGLPRGPVCGRWRARVGRSRGAERVAVGRWRGTHANAHVAKCLGVTINGLGEAMHRIKAEAGLRPNDSISIEIHGVGRYSVGDTFADRPFVIGTGSVGGEPPSDDYIGNIRDFAR